MAQRITTPCIKVCARHRGTGWCLGCGRTGPEIARWFNLSDAERATVTAALPARLAAMDLPPGGDRERGQQIAREQRFAAAAASLQDGAGPEGRP